MTIYTALKQASDSLIHISNSAQLDAELLLLHAYHGVQPVDRSWLQAHKEDAIPKDTYEAYIHLVDRRKNGEPIAYITNHKEFYDLDFYVDNRVLIPRPETELMVDAILQDIKKTTNPITVVDIGTGSGCIPVSIMKHTSREISCYAVDISSDALTVAQKNVDTHGLSSLISLLNGDLLSPFINQHHTYTHLIISANLPYLSEQVYHEHKKGLLFEPKLALVATDEGLGYYAKLLAQIVQLPSDAPITTYLEHNDEQSEALHTLITTHLPNASITAIKDLAGKRRITRLQ